MKLSLIDSNLQYYDPAKIDINLFMLKQTIPNKLLNNNISFLITEEGSEICSSPKKKVICMPINHIASYGNEKTLEENSYTNFIDTLPSNPDLIRKYIKELSKEKFNSLKCQSNDFKDSYSDLELEAILQHEIGHIALGHNQDSFKFYVYKKILSPIGPLTFISGIFLINVFLNQFLSSEANSLLCLNLGLFPIVTNLMHKKTLQTFEFEADNSIDSAQRSGLIKSLKRRFIYEICNKEPSTIFGKISAIYRENMISTHPTISNRLKEA